MTLTADLLLLLDRIARLETQKKSSFHSLLCLFIFILVPIPISVESVLLFLLRLAASFRKKMSDPICCWPLIRLYHLFFFSLFVGLSPGEDDGKFRNGFQQ